MHLTSGIIGWICDRWIGLPPGLGLGLSRQRGGRRARPANWLGRRWRARHSSGDGRQLRPRRRRPSLHRQGHHGVRLATVRRPILELVVDHMRISALGAPNPQSRPMRGAVLTHYRKQHGMDEGELEPQSARLRLRSSGQLKRAQRGRGAAKSSRVRVTRRRQTELPDLGRRVRLRSSFSPQGGASWR
jgi:hypothetical protein